ncbi:hypothetical protein OM076_13435 [Solirubrobacter ginsenosidimutans]|uniref:Uncharacterized protein n=1 Tax=Solirubrobacter ginsenosidimutans TaxID=490573 RepID=A0A9X3MRL3_9ACTN|nr:hypothetical protein [Solirubrobacter ginsenosidimutans]MDA0161274.1 hypothetical protein [Solirubrobacter ginsenosidimutans]
MPVVRVQGSAGDGEGEGEGLGGVSGLDPTVARVATNLTLSDHIGKFVAGQVANQFQNENLADTLKGKNQIMISGSWG